MNNSTFELKNVDSEDLGDVLGKIEKSFDFKFEGAELKDVKTFGELCDIITNKIQGNNIDDDCTTQQAFYKLRNAIAQILFVDKYSITPNTDLRLLFPKHHRRQKIKDLDSNIGFETDILRPKHWIPSTLVLIILASFVGLFIFWKVALPCLVLSVAGIKLAYKIGSEFDLQNVGQVAEKNTREHYLKARRNSSTVNRNEVIQKIKELFRKDLDDELVLERESTFI